LRPVSTSALGDRCEANQLIAGPRSCSLNTFPDPSSGKLHATDRNAGPDADKGLISSVAGNPGAKSSPYHGF
jgi:hypothetical protein